MSENEYSPPHRVKKFNVDQIKDAAAYFQEYGYVVFRNSFDVNQGERFWQDVEDALKSEVPLKFSHYGNIYTNPDVPLEGFKIPRIIDAETHIDSAREMMLHPIVRSFLREIYEGQEPTCLQTLTYKYSSEQGAHSDKSLVAPPYASSYDRETLVASWFAIEASDERNGALVIYPGSHRLQKRSIHDGFGDDYGAFVNHCIDVCLKAGSKPVAFRADAGDVLFWHGDFVHAGGPILAAQQQPTRRSLVCHYASIADGKESDDPHWERIPFKGASFFRARA
jgi:ectoine hydroxylase-related dioxygenase (phytanoyl-CoA dioxygenase family)